MRHIVLVLVALVIAPLGTAHAADDKAAFSLKLRGFTMGLVTLSSSADAQRYTVGGVIINTGVSRIFRQFSYTGAANGMVRNGNLRPDRYKEVADTGRRSSEALITYRNGVPTVEQYTSPKKAGPDAPDPATQGGTVDPLTAIFALLRDVPRAQACQLDVYIFDGKRRTRIAMQPAGIKDGLPFCIGRYSRLQGFTAEEVARHKKFGFVLNYRDGPNDILQVNDVSFDSFYGTAVILRK